MCSLRCTSNEVYSSFEHSYSSALYHHYISSSYLKRHNLSKARQKQILALTRSISETANGSICWGGSCSIGQNWVVLCLTILQTHMFDCWKYAAVVGDNQYVVQYRCYFVLNEFAAVVLVGYTWLLPILNIRAMHVWYSSCANDVWVYKEEFFAAYVSKDDDYQFLHVSFTTMQHCIYIHTKSSLFDKLLLRKGLTSLWACKYCMILETWSNATSGVSWRRARALPWKVGTIEVLSGASRILFNSFCKWKMRFILRNEMFGRCISSF